ncbi:uncharacterized protein P174DRAFT_397502 [Aspergillus novofumigatus IBT 16806]|uniref:Rhodopsin domain-containing protein n=1 Tax=Aspergillus novofumigatus (strain IBT 16806) TaxID=1392255 RepID=A0A2I1BTH1_ASPN1|nr:uncharacterized protein P174DRAFT_397502 [Aspergillus novofumigatus IBT 16806]PKX88634.1 hypothetical protein P174DRAFT_397502 [Aspergillus novofumigatus IBT 16806]
MAKSPTGAPTLLGSNELREVSEKSAPKLRTANEVIVAVGLAFSTSFLIMRIYTRARIMKKFGCDDILLIMAWIFSLGTQAIILNAYAHAGLGVHIDELPVSTIQTYEKCVLATSTIYIFALAFAKLALLVLYYQLLHILPVWRYTIFAVFFIIAGYSIALALALIFACHPIQKAWDISVTTGSCINRQGAYLATACTNTASDIALIIIPIPAVWNLKMPLGQKLAVIGMFTIGCLTIITSIVRLATLWPLVTSKDPTYELGLAGIFINIEANFIIMCPCLPFIRRFFRYHAPRWIRDSDRSPQGQSDTSAASQNKTSTPAHVQRQDDIEMSVNMGDEL